MQISNGAKYILLWGVTIRVKTQPHTIRGLSTHADQDGLIAAWYSHFRKRPPVWVLVHGEPQAIAGLHYRLRAELQAPVRIAKRGEVMDLTTLQRLS